MTGNESSISKSDLLFHLYECEYESADDKENRSTLRSCIYTVMTESIINDSLREFQSLSVLPKSFLHLRNSIGPVTTTSRSSALFITRLAKTTCLELLKWVYLHSSIQNSASGDGSRHNSQSSERLQRVRLFSSHQEA